MKVVLGGLKDRGEELRTFLEPRVGVKPSLNAGELEMEDSAIRKGVKPRQVKTYVKRFLHQKGLRKTFRVLVAGTQLTIQEFEREEAEEEEEAPKKEKVEAEKKVEEEEVAAPQTPEKTEAMPAAAAPPPAPAAAPGKEEVPEEKKGKAKPKPKTKKASKPKKKTEKKKS